MASIAFWDRIQSFFNNFQDQESFCTLLFSADISGLVVTPLVTPDTGISFSLWVREKEHTEMLLTGSTPPVLKSTWPTAHTTGTSCARKQAVGVTQFHSPAPAATRDYATCIGAFPRSWSRHVGCMERWHNAKRPKLSESITSLHRTHLAEGTRGAFPSHAQMLRSLPLQHKL